MAAIRHHAHVDATPDQVWQVVSDAGEISTWFPLIEDEVAEQMDGVLAEGLQGLKEHVEA